ncbi:hypothetical protein MPSEU_000057300 [Mayamaea pseudoterrestris]|nr:hypothetical protein MPSEU_000057300 [Mayamaea pseudoterrestris]
MNKSSSLPDMAMLRRRHTSDSSSMSRPESTTSLASSSSPDSLVAHLIRGSSFVRDQQQMLLQNSASQPQLRRNPASMLDLASILTDAAEFMDDYGNDGDEAISWTPRHSSKDPSVVYTMSISALNIPLDEDDNDNDDNTKTAESQTTIPITSVATLSRPWQYNDQQPTCFHCSIDFTPFERKHHCRHCGNVFCNQCSHQRCLIPPSSIVLSPKGGRHVSVRDELLQSASLAPDADPDRMLTFLSPQQELLYGKGLEERFHLAREPLRVCSNCCNQLAPLQESLRNSNSNAMRFNAIDPTDAKRLFNSPLAFTLGHEIRKASYTLNNLLPLPKRMGVLSNVNASNNINHSSLEEMAKQDLQHCQDSCRQLSPTLSNLDGVRIPARLLEQAKGVAVMTVVKAGFGLGGAEFGTGLVVARLGEQMWSAPSAIGTAGLSWGALVGAQVSDHVFLLMSDKAVELMFQQGSVQLGADVGVALGPLGRTAEADFGAAPGAVAPIYSYSMSKGFYAGVSLDGRVIMTRPKVNEKFYGRSVTGMEILKGVVPCPPAAQPLYEALTRCHVYATGNRRATTTADSQATNLSNAAPMPMDPDMAEYGEVGEMEADQFAGMSSVVGDAQSWEAHSELTEDPIH